MSEYDAVIYDLDGTLVRLDVDWGAVRREVVSALEVRDVAVPEGTLWGALDLATEAGYRQLVEERIAAHEREGARTAERLALAETLPRPEPTGVCSLNCEAACRIALELHGLDGHVDTIVGRDTVSGIKPDPQPLLTIARTFDAAPERTLFIGDTETDERAAENAGMQFTHVEALTDRTRSG